MRLTLVASGVELSKATGNEMKLKIILIIAIAALLLAVITAILLPRRPTAEGDYPSIIRTGEECWKNGDRRKAAKMFERVVAIRPDVPEGYFLLGKAYFFQQKHEEAIKQFNIFKEKTEALLVSGEAAADDYVARLHEINRLYSSIKRYDMIAKGCERIIELRPNDQLAHFNLGVCYYKHQHNRGRAINEFKKVSEINYSTGIADRARYCVDYILRNPDPRFAPDLSFYEEN